MPKKQLVRQCKDCKTLSHISLAEFAALIVIRNIQTLKNK